MMNFAFRTAGRDHEVGDLYCKGCASMERERYPRPHREYEGVTCLGLIHAEKFDGPARTIYHCDVCNANPRATFR